MKFKGFINDTNVYLLQNRYTENKNIFNYKKIGTKIFNKYVFKTVSKDFLCFQIWKKIALSVFIIFQRASREFIHFFFVFSGCEQCITKKAPRKRQKTPS